MIKELQPELNWTNIAYDCGYYDQMHLVRDFKMFSGATPSKVETTLNTSLNAMNALQSKPM